MNQDLIGNAIARVMPAAIATNLADSLITIQQPPTTYDAAGAPTVGPYTDVPGLIGLRCMRAPFNTGERMQVDEFKAVSQVAESQMYHIWMEGWFPAIVAHWRAIVDGAPHDILGVEWDSQKQMTRLKAQVLIV